MNAVKRIKSSLNIKFIYINAPLRNKQKKLTKYTEYTMFMFLCEKSSRSIFFYINLYTFLQTKKGKLINNPTELKKKTTAYSSLI